MSILKPEPTNVPGIDGEMFSINPGDLWPLPYRGSRYSLKKVGDQLKMCWSRLDIVHPSKSIPKGLIKAMVDYRHDSRGSFRITPHLEVITKRETENGWGCVYLGKLEGVFLFPGFDLDPDDIQTGNIWRGLHFKHGEEFAVWNREGNNDYLYWSHRGLYFRSSEQYPEICAKVREIRPRCGRIYFTEYGHIWMNLPEGDVSFMWAPKFRDLLQKDKQLLATNDILLQSVFARKSATYTFPIYLGRVSDFDSGIAPRTHFTAFGYFGSGDETVDDGDEFDANSWKKMQRDY